MDRNRSASASPSASPGDHHVCNADVSRATSSPTALAQSKQSNEAAISSPSGQNVTKEPSKQEHPHMESNPHEMKKYSDDENTSEDESESVSSRASFRSDTMDHYPSRISLPPQGFQRWVSRLRRRKRAQPSFLTQRGERFVLDDFDSPPKQTPQRRHSGHDRSDSQSSSLLFVTALRSATATLASASVATVSRRTSKWRRGQPQSSLASGCDPRSSIESQLSVIDEAARQRSRKRREKLKELIRTEESYFADLKALSNAYFTFLGQSSTSTSFARPAAQQTIAKIVHLHDDILGLLHRAVPFSEYDQTTAAVRRPNPVHSHTRWHSVDVVPAIVTTPIKSVMATVRQQRRSLNLSRSSDAELPLLRCSPQVAAMAARVFVEHFDRFVAYEHFAARYELLQRDIDEMQQGMHSWPDFDRAIEVLAAHVNPAKSWKENHRKAATIKDLLIKPIQRLPRYELLFNDLTKLTPVYDDPTSYAVIDGLCSQLSDICRRVDEAKDHPSEARVLEMTSTVGDRLTFSSQVPRSIFLQLLGEVVLCGCLYIAYRGRDRVKGCYVICILFESSLLLASADEDPLKYRILVGIPIARATIEETDNGKGLQCHTAPHAWKIVFEHSDRMYELLFVACSASEATAWRTQIAQGIEKQSSAVAKGEVNVVELQSPLLSGMRSIGKAFSKPGSFVRQMSVHRTATVGPANDLNQVIIKNTQAVKELHDNSSQPSLYIPRSQSVATPSHVPTLAPRRAERHQLEAILSDVWTRELLPYPGMVRRMDPLRASANHVMRKFSMASISSNFSSKRTASYTSINSSRKEDIPPLAMHSKGSFNDSLGRSSRMGRPPVNFHNAPDAFLPPDFELEDPKIKRKKLGLRTLTMTKERPFSPLLSNDVKAAKPQRAQSIHETVDRTTTSTPLPAPTPLQGNNDEEHENHPAQNRAKTPASSSIRAGDPGEEVATTKTPRKAKSKNRLLRLFG